LLHLGPQSLRSSATSACCCFCFCCLPLVNQYLVLLCFLLCPCSMCLPGLDAPLCPSLGRGSHAQHTRTDMCPLMCDMPCCHNLTRSYSSNSGAVLFVLSCTACCALAACACQA
jgi:hypothetical protein